MECCGFRPFGWREDASREARDTMPPPSRSRAFDEYRAETLRRLEQEQREFCDFLERLRMAKDKAEFDQFMADRRRAPQAAPPPGNAPSV